MSSIPPVAIPIPSTPSSPLKRSQSLPNLPVQSHPEPLASGVKVDSASLQSKRTQIEQAAEKTAKTSKRFYQPILDFFINAYQKFMDFFTPTSKAAIEKSLAKAASKQRKYLNRIDLQEALQSPEKLSPPDQEYLKAMSDIQREAIIQDGEKAQKKLDALAPKIEKLTAKYKKLLNTTTKGVERTAVATTPEEATERLEESFKEFAENLRTQGEEAVEKFRQKLPEFLKDLEKLLKGVLK